MSEFLATLQAEFRDWALDQQSRGAVISSFVRAPGTTDDQTQHQLGLAADFVGDQETLEDVAQRAVAFGYVPVFESDHLHVQRFVAGFLRSCGLV